MANPIDNLFRTLNFHAPDLTLAVAAPLSNPFISNIAATTPIVAQGAAPSLARIRFFAYDANGNPETNAVTVMASSVTQTSAITLFGVVGGTIVTSGTGAAALAAVATVIPYSSGLVDLTVTFNAAAADAQFSITNRFVTAAKAVAIA